MDEKCDPGFPPSVKSQLLRDKLERLHCRSSVMGLVASDISGRDDTGWNQHYKDNASGSTLNELSRRPWEDLDKDCLANIFSRVPTLDLLMRVSHVCKDWHRASRSPQCWCRLNFPSAPRTRNYPLNVLLKLAASRSQGGATVLLWPNDRFDESLQVEDLDFIARSFKGLRVFDLGWIGMETLKRLAEVIHTWTDLESLSIGVCHGYLAQTVAAVARSCPRFHQLQLSSTTLVPQAVAAVAEHLGPKLTYLGLARLFVPRDDLLLLLRACKALRCLKIEDCRGFRADDPDILKLGTGVQKFVYEPYEYDSDDEYAYGISMSDEYNVSDYVYDGNSDDVYDGNSDDEYVYGISMS